MSARQTEAERSSDAVCGTSGVSRRLRRFAFRRLKPAGTRGFRLRRSEPCDSVVPGARMLQHAERVMWESTPTRTVPQTSSAGTHGLPTSTVLIHANGGRNHECPSDGGRTEFGRSLRNG